MKLVSGKRSRLGLGSTGGLLVHLAEPAVNTSALTSTPLPLRMIVEVEFECCDERRSSSILADAGSLALRSTLRWVASAEYA
jgi:hypothetical protein